MAQPRTIHDAINSQLIKWKKDNRDYVVLLAHANTWLNDRNRVLATKRRTTEIYLSNKREAVLPEDYVDWLSVGRQLGDRVINLAFSEKVPQLPPTPAVPVTLGVQAPLPAQYDDCCCTYAGWAGGVLHGYGSALFQAEFTINEEKRLLYATSAVESGPLYLQYVANDDKPNERTVLHPDHLNLIQLFMRWQYFEDEAPGKADRASDLYHTELKKVSRRASPFTVDTMYDILERTNGF